MKKTKPTLRPTEIPERPKTIPSIPFWKIEDIPLTMTEAQGYQESRNAEQATYRNNLTEEQLDTENDRERLLEQIEIGRAEEARENVKVPIDSFEASIGYSSLMRQMHKAYVRRVAYYRSSIGGSLSVEEARKRAFHEPVDQKTAKEMVDEMLRLPVDSLNFIDLHNLQAVAPNLAEAFWELAKEEGRKEFESGHLAANITFPVGYMKEVWNIARYLGVRESFIADWQPKGGIELSLIEMTTQSYFQWQYWLEQTVRRSQTREREEHPDYTKFRLNRQEEAKASGWSDGFWFRPTVDEVAAVENAVQMADRWNRIYMRTLRQLRDLRRFNQVQINNPSQVNIAADGGRQVNSVS